MSIHKGYHYDDHNCGFYLDANGDRIPEGECMCAAMYPSECACDCTSWNSDPEPTIQCLGEFTAHIQSLSDLGLEIWDIRAAQIYINGRRIDLPRGWVDEDLRLFLNELCIDHTPGQGTFFGTIWYVDAPGSWSEYINGPSGSYWKFVAMPEIEL